MNGSGLEAQPGGSLIGDVADWLIRQSLGTTTAEELLEQCALRLNAAGVPVWRATVGFRILHPLYNALSLTWYRDGGLRPERFYLGGEHETEDWRLSPGHHIIRHGLPFLRRHLTGPEAQLDFPILQELREEGCTDYLTYLVRFGVAEYTEDGEDGMLGSWATDREDGFTDDNIRALMRIQQRLAVACKIVMREQITKNVLSAYLGPDAGNQVLQGQIKLGDGEIIHAVIWYCDLRNSTGLASRLPPQEFIAAVNEYFQCTAGAVLDHSGEVLRFIGDAVLAIFPIRSGEVAEEEACASALDAARDAFVRLEAVNDNRRERGDEALAFGLGLHVGDVMYGNIGVPERIEFSVVGPTANEVARLESLTKELKRPLVVSDRFKEAIERPWESLGVHELRGAHPGMNVYSLSGIGE